jgi:hypothetical protein
VPDGEAHPASGSWQNPPDRKGRAMIDSLEEKIQQRAYRFCQISGQLAESATIG